jgi:hypothetical protein
MVKKATETAGVSIPGFVAATEVRRLSAATQHDDADTADARSSAAPAVSPFASWLTE